MARRVLNALAPLWCHESERYSGAAVAKSDNIPQLLERYAERPPAEMLLSERYYQDLLLHSPQLETTVMLVTTRDLPLAQFQRCTPF
jgi:hypothetical protein